ncbi:MAG: monovalent cation/H(+) antiporter subunit G [Oscillospiraceae bacterium]|nr:monovalent cation/H(+) antiporter subunit G [Oscillospiraceae bacterium]
MKTIIGCIFIGAGILVLLTSVFGMFRFKYSLNRMHASAIADTLGVGLFMAGCIILTGLRPITGKMILLLIFLWLTAPISSHLVSRMDILTQQKPGKYWKEEKR